MGTHPFHVKGMVTVLKNILSIYWSEGGVAVRTDRVNFRDERDVGAGRGRQRRRHRAVPSSGPRRGRPVLRVWICYPPLQRLK